MPGGGGAGDAGRQRSRCWPQIGSNVRNHIYCARWGMDWERVLGDGKRTASVCAVRTGIRGDGVEGSGDNGPQGSAGGGGVKSSQAKPAERLLSL